MTRHAMAFTFEVLKSSVSCRLVPWKHYPVLHCTVWCVGRLQTPATPAVVHRGCSSRTAATKQRLETTAARGGEEGQMHAVGVEVHSGSCCSVPGLVSATVVEITTRGHTSGCLPPRLCSLSLFLRLSLAQEMRKTRQIFRGLV